MFNIPGPQGLICEHRTSRLPTAGKLLTLWLLLIHSLIVEQASSDFHYGLKTSSSPEILQAFGTRLRLLRHPAL